VVIFLLSCLRSQRRYVVQPCCAFHAISLALPKYSPVVYVIHTKYLVDDDSSRSFNDDSSQMRVACFGMLPRRVRLPLELSLAQRRSSPSCRALSKRDTWPNPAAMVTAEISAMPVVLADR